VFATCADDDNIAQDGDAQSFWGSRRPPNAVEP
jgi:hypothetical protein